MIVSTDTLSKKVCGLAVSSLDVYADRIRKGRALYSQMLRANITKVSISETPSIRAFALVGVRARKRRELYD